jgi:hypothetical protein
MSHVSNDDYVVFQQTSSSSWLDSDVEEFLELHQVVANLHSRDLPCACAVFLESISYIYIYVFYVFTQLNHNRCAAKASYDTTKALGSSQFHM